MAAHRFQQAHLAPYFAFALFLHLALLTGVPLRVVPPSPPEPKTLTVSLRPRITTPPVIPARDMPPARANRSTPSVQPTPARTLMTAPDTAPALPNTPAINPSQWLESAKHAAREEAQNTSKLEQKRAASPVGTLNAPSIAKEEVLGNGMRRITTSAGTTYCLQPPPVFARDQASLYNVPVTCP
ncbi:MAG: hypothetical protein AB1400_00520 [Pseudomonadota bacterium]